MDLCTLFDSNYLDRGIALCESLNRVLDHFRLYVFAFDESAYRILKELNIRNVTVVSEESILDDELRRIRQERSRSEYCWTCTPVIVEYVLDHYGVEACTYIDADMYFYSSPEFVFEEIKGKKCSASIIEHRFPNNITRSTNLRLHGKYCVEFNTFFNTEESRKILTWWKKKCFESCSMKLNEESFGDQKYLDEWEKRFGNIHEVENAGAGVAPWNLSDYRLEGKESNGIYLTYKGKQRVKLVFYHFQNLRFLDENTVNIGVYNEIGRKDRALINELYIYYVKRLVEIRKYLKNKYNLNFKAYENRKKGSKWKYTGLKDLVAYIAIYINIRVRSKKDIYLIGRNMAMHS